ncbi:MAG: LLM class flavin-dependent oxidoreductase, partial [Acidimicrobiia bacterium]
MSSSDDGGALVNPTGEVKIGITLPSFRDDPEIAIAVAVAAERAGVNGVFAYDHLFRVAADGRMRPALECTTLLGAVAAETSRISLGTLVARATLRAPATLAVALDTIQRVSGGRLLAAIGAGDSESRPENESYGLGFGTRAE